MYFFILLKTFLGLFKDYSDYVSVFIKESN